jgi:hypothetical protein
MDYWFDHRPERAAFWPTIQEAERDCVIFNYHRIVIPSSHGGTHVCDGFRPSDSRNGYMHAIECGWMKF